MPNLVEGHQTVTPAREPLAHPKHELAKDTIVTIHTDGYTDVHFRVSHSFQNGAAYLLEPEAGLQAPSFILKPLPSHPDLKDVNANFDSFVEHQVMLNEAHNNGITNVPKPLGFLEIDEGENAGLYAMEEYREGVTLRDHLRQHTLNAKHKLELFEQLVETIGALHELGIIHRDIHPRNILIEPDGSLALIDLGRSGRKDVAFNYTRSAFGADGYRPLEQMLVGEQIPAASNDIYSLGMVLLYMFGGKPSDEHTSAVSAELSSPVLDSLAYEKLYNSNYDISQIIFDATQIQPGQRTASADLMLSAVRQAIARR